MLNALIAAGIILCAIQAIRVKKLIAAALWLAEGGPGAPARHPIAVCERSTWLRDRFALPCRPARGRSATADPP